MPDTHITQLLSSASSPEGGRSDELLVLVYDQLRRIAQSRIAGERPGNTLQATALVHEAYMRLVGGEHVSWVGRAHFFAAAGEAMRRILIEHARAKGRQKRGGDGTGGKARRVSLDVVDLATSADSDEILSVDEAVCRLEQRDPDLGRIVRLRFFAGLSEKEVAEVLGVTDRTVRRDWALARGLLLKDLEGDQID